MKLPAWKLFEQDVQGLFKARQELEPLVYHRFYDTAAAGNFLPAQPGDHLIISRGHAILIETKCSTVRPSLRSCFSNMVKNTQIMKHRLWQRAGATTFFLFRADLPSGKNHELWDGRGVVKARLGRHLLPKNVLVKQGPDLDQVLRDISLHLVHESVVLF